MKKMFLNLFISRLTVMPLAAGAANKAPKVLIVYYSLSGNTESVSQKLQEKTGGDLFRIETVRTYPEEYPAKTEEPKKELDTGQLPALKAMPTDLSSYDLILVGTPIWGYTVSTPVMSFLKQADFGGKKVAAFSTHEGGLGQSFPHFKEQAKNAVVLEGLDLYKPGKSNDNEVDKALDTWLGKIQK